MWIALNCPIDSLMSAMHFACICSYQDYGIAHRMIYVEIQW